MANPSPNPISGVLTSQNIDPTSLIKPQYDPNLATKLMTDTLCSWLINKGYYSFTAGTEYFYFGEPLKDYSIKVSGTALVYATAQVTFTLDSTSIFTDSGTNYFALPQVGDRFLTKTKRVIHVTSVTNVGAVFTIIAVAVDNIALTSSDLTTADRLTYVGNVMGDGITRNKNFLRRFYRYTNQLQRVSHEIQATTGNLTTQTWVVDGVTYNVPLAYWDLTRELMYGMEMSLVTGLNTANTAILTSIASAYSAKASLPSTNGIDYEVTTSGNTSTMSDYTFSSLATVFDLFHTAGMGNNVLGLAGRKFMGGIDNNFISLNMGSGTVAGSSALQYGKYNGDAIDVAFGINKLMNYRGIDMTFRTWGVLSDPQGLGASSLSAVTGFTDYSKRCYVIQNQKQLTRETDYTKGSYVEAQKFPIQLKFKKFNDINLKLNCFYYDGTGVNERPQIEFAGRKFLAESDFGFEFTGVDQIFRLQGA